MTPLEPSPPISAKHRIYIADIADIAFNHIADGKLHVVDGENGNYLPTTAKTI